MPDEHETVSVEDSEEDSDDDDWGYWTAKGPRMLSTHELPAATASNRTVASKKAALVKPSDDWVPGSASDPIRSQAPPGSQARLEATTVCQALPA